MTGNAIEAVGLSKRFLLASERRTSLKERLVRGRPPEPKTFWALKDASFSVPKGSSLGIIGHNGSGKSTALKVLVGIYRPTSGLVRVNGSVSALLEVGAGFHPELTGRENIRLNATILGFTKREIDLFIDQIIEFADIGEHIDAPLKHFSSGMHVRLGFAVAVMVRPEILIVDEVIAVGDEEFQRKCYEYLYDLRRAGTSMVVVSHGLGQITDLCDHAVWLDHGRIQGMGPARKVVRSYIEEVNAREVGRNSNFQVQQVLAAEAVEELRGVDVATTSAAEETATASDAYESAMAPIAEPVPLERPSGRRGSGEIRIRAIDFLDGDGDPADLLISGQPATVRLHYQARTDCDRCVFGLGFDTRQELIAAGINNRHQADWSIRTGEGFVDFRAEPLLLAGGRYRVRITVEIAGATADAIDDGLFVTVRAPDVEIAGVYLQPGGWSLHDGSSAPTPTVRPVPDSWSSPGAGFDHSLIQHDDAVKDMRTGRLPVNESLI